MSYSPPPLQKRRAADGLLTDLAVHKRPHASLRIQNAIADEGIGRTALAFAPRLGRSRRNGTEGAEVLFGQVIERFGEDLRAVRKV